MTYCVQCPRIYWGDVAGFSWQGMLGGHAVLEVSTRDPDALKLKVDVANGCVFSTVPAFADTRRFSVPFVHRVLEPDGSVFEMSAGPGSSNWTPYYDINPALITTVLGHEDAGFFRHSGFFNTFDSLGPDRQHQSRTLCARSQHNFHAVGEKSFSKA